MWQILTVRFKSISLIVILTAILAIAFLSSCSTFIGKGYENTTGRYNSYFLAKEKMKEVDVALKAKMKDDYHKILSIHYPSDSNFGKSQSAALEEVFKYASWSVRWHKRSKWADNNYILIGKVRQYQYNYKDGLETFKYVNATSTNPVDKHEALIQLMKFFTDFNEYDNVKYVIDFLDKESEMTKKNRRNYLIAKASYFQHYEDYYKVHQLLDTALPLCSRKHDKARLRFINGQISEYLKTDSEERKIPLAFDPNEEAAKNYKITLKSNPPYELWFNARLNLMRVSKHSDIKDIEKTKKYFYKLLADQKNVDYKDRIYYELAAFERRQKEFENAEGDYKKSVRNATNNQRQKAYSYLSLGEMYYEDRQQFENAKLYYDSAIAILPKDHKGYGKIFRRQRILKDFVDNLLTVKREDSLQRLAKMDTIELNKLISAYVQKEEKRLNEEAQRLAKLAKKNSSSSGISPFNSEFQTNNPNAPAPNLPAGFNTGQQAAQFYFYNTAIAAQGRAEFQQKWGRRRLEDFWRISAKESAGEEIKALAAADTTKSKQANDSTASNGGKVPENDEVPLITVNKADLYNSIPSTPEKLKVSHEKIQGSLFKLGKIYNQHLSEPENAVKSLNRLINDYPDNENVPEAHYMIYLISRGKDTNRTLVHKNILLQKYPHTIYAKMVQNPNYLAESKIINKQIMAKYKVAYSEYLNQNYKNSDSLLTLIQTEHPNSEYDPQIDLLKALIKVRTGAKEEYKNELQAYLNEYKSGKYHEYAQELLDKFEGKKPKVKNIPQDTVKAPDQNVPNINTPTIESPPSHTQPGVDQMPEEIKKMYEEHMRQSTKGGVNLNNSTNPQTPQNTSPGQNIAPSSPNIPGQAPSTNPAQQPSMQPINGQ